MRALIQRVSRASVTVDDNVVGAIGRGLLVLLGVGKDDNEQHAAYLAHKVVGLRIFPDERGHMNRSVADIGGELLVVSQFTLYGDVRNGMRPSFIRAAPPEEAKRLYEEFVSKLAEAGLRVATGVFQASMQVELINEGPVTIFCDSERLI